jgi:peptidoglycan/xylan/chitin deacetylase (PgdA/CDA1 family)
MIKSGLSEPEKTIHVSQKTFDKQMRMLSKKGYTPISLMLLQKYFLQKASLPDKPVIITFDDGYVDNFRIALPVLRKYNFIAEIFLPTDLIDTHRHNVFNKHPLMNWDEIRQMHDRGISFSSHTATHPRLTELKDEEILEELTRSRQKLQEVLGEECTCIAYPYGDFDRRVRDLTEQAGYKAACSTKIGLNRFGDDPLALKRVSIIDLDHPGRFLRKVTFGLWDVPWSIVPKYYVKRAMEKIGTD